MPAACRLLRQAWLLVVLVLSMAYWAVGGLLFVLAGMLLGHVLPAEKSRAIGQWLLQAAFDGFLRLLRLCGWRGGVAPAPGERRHEQPLHAKSIAREVGLPRKC